MRGSYFEKKIQERGNGRKRDAKKENSRASKIVEGKKVMRIEVKYLPRLPRIEQLLTYQFTDLQH